MKNIIQDILQTQLFSGVSPQEAAQLLPRLYARSTEYRQDTVIIEEGGCVRSFGLLLNGNGRSFKTDAEGRTITITLLKKGSEIGVILAAGTSHTSPVSVEVQKGSTILFISFGRLMDSSLLSCPGHLRLMQNYMGILAEKGLVLHQRIDCLLRPTARGKILAFLTRAAEGKTGPVFTIAMDRKAMAQYLNLDRSALSRELSRMKQDGIIDFYKSTFRLLQD